MTVKLGKVIQVDVRRAWSNEAAHFTPWLASPDGLELLQDALGMDLEVEATEQFIGPFPSWLSLEHDPSEELPLRSTSEVGVGVQFGLQPAVN